MKAATGTSRVQRVRHEPRRRDLVVTRIASPSPNFRLLTLAGESLADFTSASFDDHVKLMLDVPGAAAVLRDYTPRAFDPGARELQIEFALHGAGPAADWAAQARPGQRITVAGPRGSAVVPFDYDWHLLVGDDSALPAIARRLEELPAGTQVQVLLRLADAADRRQFAGSTSAQVTWAHSDGELLGAVRALQLPAGEGYAWCAGELGLVRALRDILVREKGHSRYAIRAAAYWKRGAIAHHENLDDPP